MQSSWVQYIIVILAIGGPLLGRVLQTLEKQRKQRLAQRALEVQRHEALRTGAVATPRATVTPQAIATPQATGTPPARSATQRMQELARNRQQQLDELRRRQQSARQTQGRSQQLPPAHTQGGSKPQGPRPTGQPAYVPTVRSSSQSNPLPPPRTPARTPTRIPVRTPVRAPQQVARSRDQALMPQPVRPAARPPRVVPRTEESDTPATSIHKLEIDPHVQHPCTEASVTPVQIMGKTMDATDWRRFIIARELLDPPLALRQPGEGSFE